MDDLTKEQQQLLTLMYKEILNRQPALSMEKANKFKNSDQNSSNFSLSICHQTMLLNYVGN